MIDTSVKIIYLILTIIWTMSIYVIGFMGGLVWGMDKERKRRKNDK